MKTTLKRIYTSDGLELVGLLYEPDKATKSVLVHVHGMGGNFYENSFLDFIAKTLTSNGIAFFTFNNRGCETFKDLAKTVDGKKTFVRIGNAYEIFEECALDIKSAIDAVSEWGFKDIHLSGHSLGAPKVIYYMDETEDERIKSILLLSPADMLGLEREDMKRFDDSIKEAKEKVAAGNGDELLSKKLWSEYPLSATTYISLFDDNSKDAVLNFYDPKDELKSLSVIKVPLTAIMGRKDDALTVSIEDTMERITKAAIDSTKVETKILGDANHGYIGSEQQLADAIFEWIKSL